MQHFDVAIIGAGPIGLELAVALKQTPLKVLQLEARQIGHTISWFAPQTRFFSSNDRIAIAGVPLQTGDQSKASREEYLAYLRSVVQQYDLKINAFEPVSAIAKSGNGFHLTTSRAVYSARNIVIATGGTEKPRRLNIPGEDLPFVSHYFHDPHLYFRRRLLIVGGRNSAVETALRCHRAGSEVSISYRRDKLDGGSIKYWLMPEIASLLDTGKIKGYFQTQPLEITADHVVLKKDDGAIIKVPADAVLLLTGYEADMTLCEMAGVDLIGDGRVPRFHATTMQTNVLGVYLAGTATAGTQERYKVFIENCHMHVDRIVASLMGASPPDARVSPAVTERPET